MEINISKKDVVWSYIGQFFNIAAGFITLPFVLHMLSTEEIAMNYLMLSVSTLVALMDFGFTPQINRLVSYVYSGSTTLSKEGYIESQSNEVCYPLLCRLIIVTKKIFQYISLITLGLLITAGTWYMYSVTEGFTNVTNSLLIWCVFSASIFFTIYFKYYDALLVGRGLVKESKQAVLYSKLLNIFMIILLLYLGVGLLGICLSNLLSPFLGRGLAHHYFYDKTTVEKLSGIEVSETEKKETFNVIWYNAKKTGVNFLGTYCVRQFGLFISGLFLSAPIIASYGLMMNLVSILASTGSTLLNTYLPKIISSRIEGDQNRTVKLFSFTIVAYQIIFIIGAIVIVILGPWALSIIHSNADLPVLYILLLYLIVAFLEENHSNFCIFITTGNKIPFVPAALIAGALICVGDYLVLKFTSLGLLGVVAVQGLIQLAYNNWHWPKIVLDEFRISYPHFLKVGSMELASILKKEIKNVFIK